MEVMFTKEDLKKESWSHQRAREITEIGETVLRNPELGYKEVKTAALVEEKFRSMGLSCKKGLALTGLTAHVPGKSRKLQVALMGELDSIRIPVHPFADPLTGAAHGCGHNAQIAGMLGRDGPA
jgi:metal-dependent amidase/aminoacylase/carboxypeptidase family protein